jgi:hypothetical protein
VLRCVRGAHFQLPWLSLAVPGCPWLSLAASGLLLGCSWLLLADPGLLLAAPACSWLLLAASGCSWLFLAAVDVKSRSKENNLFGVLRWDHIPVIYFQRAGNVLVIQMLTWLRRRSSSWCGLEVDEDW